MNFRKTLILFLVLLVAGVYVYKTEVIDRQKELKEQKASFRLFDFDKDTITKIRIKGKNEPVEITRNGDKWNIKSPIVFPADDKKIDGLIKAAAKQTAREIIGEDGEDLSVFGLDKPEWEISFYEEGREKPHVLTLGNKSPNGAAIYGRTTKLGKTFTVRLGFPKQVGKTLFDMREKRLLDGFDSEINKVEYVSGETRIVLEKENADKWNIVYPIKTLADKIETNVIINKILHASAKNFADGTLTAEQTGLINIKKKVSLWKKGEKEPQTLLFGKQPPGWKGTWVMRERDGLTAMLEDDFWKIIPKTLLDFRDKNIFRLKPEEVRRVRLEKRDGVMEIVKQNGSWKIISPEKTLLNQVKTEEFINSLLGAELDDFTGGRKFPLPDSEIENPLLQISVTTKDKTINASFFTHNQNENLRFGKSGVYEENFTVTKETFDRMNKKSRSIVDRRLFKIQHAKVGLVTIKRDDKILELAKSRDQWKLRLPEKRIADARKADFLVSIIVNSEYEGKLKDGVKIEKTAPIATIALESVGGGRKYELQMLRRNETEGMIVAIMTGDESVYLLKPELLEALPKNMEDLLP